MTRNHYDADGRLTSTAINADGASDESIETTTTYDAFGNTISMARSYRGAAESQFEVASRYDALNRVVALTDANGFSETTVYDEFGNRVSMTRGAYLPAASDPDYDAAKAANASAHAQTTAYAYDANDRLLETTDGEGNQTACTWDSRGNKLSSTEGIAGPTSNDQERLVSTLNEWDLADRLTQVTSGSSLVQNTYDSVSNVTETKTRVSGEATPDATDDVWNTKQYTYDLNGRVATETNSIGTTGTYSYDALDHVTEKRETGTDSNGTRTRTDQYEYDKNGNAIRTTDALGNSTTFTYDAVGNQTSSTDARQLYTSFAYYDGANRLVSSVDNERYLIEYELDASGNTTETRTYMEPLASPPSVESRPTPNDPENRRTTKNTYDGANQLIREDAADSSYSTYTYTSAKDALQKTLHPSSNSEPLSRTLDTTPRIQEWNWDHAGRMTQATGLRRTDQPASDAIIETYQYDAANNQTVKTVSNSIPLANGNSDPDRVTQIQYDDQNRPIQRTYGSLDPSTQQTETTEFDDAGNILRFSNGQAIHLFEYDELNRIRASKDPMGNETTYAYDAFSSISSLTDAKGSTTHFIYDLLGQCIEIRSAAMEFFSAPPQFSTGIWNLLDFLGANGDFVAHPTTTLTYDEVGNLVQYATPNANSNEVDKFSPLITGDYTTTYWFDGNNRKIGQLNGDFALQTTEYNATGSVTAVTRSNGKIAPSSAPRADTAPPPAVEPITQTLVLDAEDRVLESVFSEVETYTISTPATETSPPVLQPIRTRLADRSFYDAWGNLVESNEGVMLDAAEPGGVSSYSYHDALGRQVATVDADGFVIETAYDSQDHVVQQINYVSPIQNPSAGTLPTPSGTSYATDQVYDATDNLIYSKSPSVMTTSGLARVGTSMTYDERGNETRREINVDSSEANSTLTEYTYYDLNDREVAVVDGNRVLNITLYDSLGNTTRLERFYQQVTASDTQLATELPSNPDSRQDLIDFFGISENKNMDQWTTLEYNRLSRAKKVTSHGFQSSGGSDESRADISMVAAYDPNGNITRKVLNTPVSGNVQAYESNQNVTTLNQFNSQGMIVNSLLPNDSISRVEYNTAGNTTEAWISPASVELPPRPQGISASVTNGLNPELQFDWAIEAGPSGISPAEETNSWVFWDKTSHTMDPDHPTPSIYPNQQQGTPVQDESGEVEPARFNTQFPVETGTPIYYRVFTQNTEGLWAWSQEYSVTVETTNTVRSISTDETDGTFSITASFAGPVTSAKLVLSDSTHVTMANQGTGQIWRGELEGISAPQEEEIAIEWVAAGVVSESTPETLLKAPYPHQFVSASENDTTQWVQWKIPTDTEGNPTGTTQRVFFEGTLLPENSQRVNRTQENLQFAPELTTPEPQNYSIIYGNSPYPADSTSTQVSMQTGGSDTTIEVTLGSDEAPEVNEALKIEWKPSVPTDGYFHTALDMTLSGATWTSPSIDLNASTAYEIKVFYTDSEGHEVLVQWMEITTPDSASSSTVGPVPGQSISALAQETNGVITRSATSSSLTVSPGYFSGDVDASSTSTALSSIPSPGTLGFQQTEAQTPTYYTEYRYDVLGRLVETNENDGIWRTYGLDSRGNALLTQFFGSEIFAESPPPGFVAIETYATYDNRNNPTQEWSPLIGDPSDGIRGITTSTWNFVGDLEQQTQPGMSVPLIYTYDGVGNIITEAYGGDGILVGDVSVTTLKNQAYDEFGNLVRETQPGTGSTLVYQYGDAEDPDLSKRNRLLARQTEGLSNTLENFTYDSFGRIIETEDGGGNRTALSWDQRNRLTEISTPEGSTTNYTYDAFDRQIWTRDANGNFAGQAYDSMGNLDHQYSYRNDQNSAAALPSTVAEAFAGLKTDSSFYDQLVDIETPHDIYNNIISETYLLGGKTERTIRHSWEAFGRLKSTYVQYTDIAGSPMTTYFVNDTYGRRTEQTSTNGQKLEFTYDDDNNTTKVEDRTLGQTTDYQYDIAGRRTKETRTGWSQSEDNATIDYSYWENGWLRSWSNHADSETFSSTYHYDQSGNTVTIGRSVPTLYQAAQEPTAHTYTYDAANRVMAYQNGDEERKTFTYDNAGNRANAEAYQKTGGSWTPTSSQSYTYDKDGLVTSSVGTNDQSWTYDSVGNITRFSQDPGTDDAILETYTYSSTYLEISSTSEDESAGTNSTTNTTYNDWAQTSEVENIDHENDDDTDDFSYVYNPNGLVKQIDGTGDGSLTGSSKMNYDANDNLSKLNLGENQNSDSDEIKSFSFDAQGHIISRKWDPGQSDSDDYPDDFARRSHYFYANGNPVGEYGVQGTDDSLYYYIDETNDDATSVYQVLQDIGQYFPSTTIEQHSIASGDTLASLAGTYYGNPSLWFIIAEANGLDPATELAVGSQVVIPNTVENGRIPYDSHAVYDAGNIIGSELPQLKAPSPGACKEILAIVITIIVTVIAIVATVLTAGAASASLVAAIGIDSAILATTVSVVVGAAIGAGFFAVSNAIEQGVYIGLGLQEEFSWKDVGVSAITGAFMGAGLGLTGAVEALIGEGAEEIGGIAAPKAARAARAAAGGLSVLGTITTEEITTGKINWKVLGIQIGIEATLGYADWRFSSEAKGTRKSIEELNTAEKEFYRDPINTRKFEQQNQLAELKFQQEGALRNFQGEEDGRIRLMADQENERAALIEEQTRTLNAEKKFYSEEFAKRRKGILKNWSKEEQEEWEKTQDEPNRFKRAWKRSGHEAIVRIGLNTEDVGVESKEHLEDWNEAGEKPETSPTRASTSQRMSGDEFGAIGMGRSANARTGSSYGNDATGTNSRRNASTVPSVSRSVRSGNDLFQSSPDTGNPGGVGTDYASESRQNRLFGSMRTTTEALRLSRSARQAASAFEDRMRIQVPATFSSARLRFALVAGNPKSVGQFLRSSKVVDFATRNTGLVGAPSTRNSGKAPAAPQTQSEFDRTQILQGFTGAITAAVFLNREPTRRLAGMPLTETVSATKRLSATFTLSGAASTARLAASTS
ncbi:hypothetical protein MK489_24920 [Myxococcota bacterium]|nr:hypothetical protein [Myxococcota bacterium]